jgi:hypothetical protein
VALLGPRAGRATDAGLRTVARSYSCGGACRGQQGLPAHVHISGQVQARGTLTGGTNTKRSSSS